MPLGFPDIMALSAGTKLGPYQITDQIGAGGMGEVYSATDTRLDRTVAIKVLPDHLATDPQRRERFEREAKAVSSLNHPHICTLHDVGEQDGTYFLVMELVEGDTLEQRLQKGRLPLDQVLEYAIQIADALDKAHRQGVVHRDLKPGNIMVTKSGVKLLDFGLAKLKGDDGPVSPMSQMPTQGTAPLTAEGTILGTLQYMAPEQLEGLEADSRTDIFAFGAVVYELVTGKRAFEGKSQASLIGAIMNSEPQAMDQLEAMTPHSLDRIVRTCLAKDPDDRWQTARDLMREIGWVTETEPAQVSTPQPQATRSREQIAWSALAIVTLIAAFTTVIALRPASLAPETRIDIAAPDGTSFFALSPDGRNIAFSSSAENGRLMLWVQSLDTNQIRLIDGTENALFPSWLPDSQSIVFGDIGGSIYNVIDIATGSIQSFSGDVLNGSAPGWSSDGTILIATTSGFETYSSIGGVSSAPEPLVPPGAPFSPTFLPDDSHFIYGLIGDDPGDSGIYLGQLGEPGTRKLVDADTNALYMNTGHLLFVRQNVLLAQEFSMADLEVKGDAQVVAPGVGTVFGTYMPASVSNTGTIIYRSLANSAGMQFVWRDRNGSLSESLSGALEAESGNPELSSDGRTVIFEQFNGVSNTGTGLYDIYKVELERGGILNQFTFDDTFAVQPTWSPDDSRIAYMSQRGTGQDIYAAPSNRIGTAEALVEGPDITWPADWSQDYLLYNHGDDSGQSLRALRMDGSGEDVAVVESNGNHSSGQFSPGGDWIAYQTARSGSTEIWVKRFPDGVAAQVSTNGGEQVRWGPDGNELFYVARDRQLMSVEIVLPPNGETAIPGTPNPLFQLGFGGVLEAVGQQYDVHPDGERFLVMERDGTPQPVTMIQNWRPANAQ
jgi:serine/threonine protein kinase